MARVVPHPIRHLMIGPFFRNLVCSSLAAWESLGKCWPPALQRKVRPIKAGGRSLCPTPFLVHLLK